MDGTGGVQRGNIFNRAWEGISNLARLAGIQQKNEINKPQNTETQNSEGSTSQAFKGAEKSSNLANVFHKLFSTNEQKMIDKLNGNLHNFHNKTFVDKDTGNIKTLYQEAKVNRAIFIFLDNAYNSFAKIREDRPRSYINPELDTMIIKGLDASYKKDFEGARAAYQELIQDPNFKHMFQEYPEMKNVKFRI